MEERYNNRCLCVIIVLLSISFAVGRTCKANSLTLNVHSCQDTYVIGEPIKLIIRISNYSNQTERIVESELLNNNMEFMLFEITPPDNRVEIRSTQQWIKERFINPNYAGEPLFPGEFIEFYLYPNYSILIDHSRQEGVVGMEGRTFTRAGKYRLRVAYFLPKYWRILKNSVAEELYSNQIEINFRNPTLQEKEILDAYWVGANFIARRGDIDGQARFDETALRSVISKYPNEPLVKYAYFALMRSLAYRPISTSMPTNDPVPGLKEIEILGETLMNRFPEFRYFEIRNHIARNIARDGRKSESLKLYQDCLTKMPQLKDHYGFMANLIIVKYGRMEAITEWSKSRREGRKQYKIDFENKEP